MADIILRVQVCAENRLRKLVFDSRLFGIPYSFEKNFDALGAVHALLASELTSVGVTYFIPVGRDHPESVAILVSGLPLMQPEELAYNANERSKTALHSILDAASRCTTLKVLRLAVPSYTVVVDQLLAEIAQHNPELADIFVRCTLWKIDGLAPGSCVLFF